jgi:dienelactone hydrolase
MVGVRGSGRVDRSNLYQGEAARYFTPRGVRFFMYDKRGVGASEGSYPGSYSSSMATYAVDVLAAVDRLAANPKVDASRIGLWGMSQAGWIIPLAASMGQDAIAFTITVSGPTVSIAEENAYSDLTGLTQGRPSGATDEERRDRANRTSAPISGA